MTETEWSFVLLKNLYLDKKIALLKTSYKDVQYFNLITHINFGLACCFFFCPFQIFFLPLSFSFSWPFLLSYLWRLIFFLAVVNSWCKLRATPGNGTWINYGYNWPFHHNFCNETDNIGSIYYIRMSLISAYRLTLS